VGGLGPSGGTGTGGSDAGAGGSMGGEDGSGGADGHAGAGGTSSCFTVIATPLVPTVVLLVDTSSSMWDVVPAWSILHEGLMDDDSGAVARFDDRIRFGFSSYKGHLGASEEDPACATMTTVQPALDNYDAIESVYGAITGPETGPIWQTPTNYAINHATSALLADGEAPGRKFIFLVTDGNPNTCVTVDPQCGQDHAVKATQDAFANGIGLLVLGIGDIVESPNSGCDPTTSHCGEAHLQDLANAGVGAGVLPPPNCDDPTSAGCTARYTPCTLGGELQASYTPGAPTLGRPGVLATTGPDAAANVADTVSAMLSGLLCSFELTATLDPAAAMVTLGDSELTAGDPNGFALDATELTLLGAACDSFQDGMALEVRAGCDGS
jgi:hypothetical protein